MNIAIVGYGNMGKAIEAIAIERSHHIIFKTTGKEPIEEITEKLQKADVAIEFTGATSAFDNIAKCFSLNIPVVSGSTGWLEKYDKILSLCQEQNGSFIYSSNFSMGVNILFALNELLAKLMNGQSNYTTHIQEIHHSHKKDAPSGTAISLANQILGNNPQLNNWQFSTEPVQGVINMESIRTGEVPGTHTVSYRSNIDNIELKHTAHNRKGFALGAVLAAEFLQGKQGVYTMKDVLNIS